MKKFICYSSRQERLDPYSYQAVDNPKLHYGEPGAPAKAVEFPVIPLLNGYAESNEEVELVIFTEEYGYSKRNCDLLCRRALDLCAEKNIKLRNNAPTVVPIPYEDGIDAQLNGFQTIIDHIDDEDEIYACITYSSKPGEVVEMMALRYARQVKKNTSIECVVYGSVDFKKHEAWIYDETALLQLDDILKVLSEYGSSNISQTLKKLISL